MSGKSDRQLRSQSKKLLSDYQKTPPINPQNFNSDENPPDAFNKSARTARSPPTSSKTINKIKKFESVK